MSSGLDPVDLDDKIFDSEFGIEYCPCCFTGYRIKIGTELGCGHSICPDCGVRMNEYKPGDFVEAWKHQCPLCRTQIPYSADRFGSQLSSTTMDRTLVYRFCEIDICGRIFDAGEKTCSERKDEFPSRCPVHRPQNQFRCPNCNEQLEYAGGCLHFTCCIRGTDRCLGSSCDHGGLCGHQWYLDRSQAVIAPDMRHVNHRYDSDDYYSD